MGYHTVVVDPFNSEGYNILAARKLKVYCPLARKLKGSPALAPKIAESLAYFLNWHQATKKVPKNNMLVAS
jgi:hypothetical protein